MTGSDLEDVYNDAVMKAYVPGERNTLLHQTGLIAVAEYALARASDQQYEALRQLRRTLP